MKEFGRLMDCHTHIQDIKFRNIETADFFNKKVGDVRWHGVSIESHAEHIRSNNLEVVYAIYENPETLVKLREAAPGCDVRGMFFVRDINYPDKYYIRTLFAKGFIQGLKVHPVIDNFSLTTQNLKNVLDLAREFSVPLLYHSDDRSKFWQLTAPELQEDLVRENPDVKFIIGHGGAYAHPRLVGSHPSVIAYWEGSAQGVSRRKLVTSALELAYLRDNAFYDLTVATNSVKAGIITEFLHKYSEAAEKILVGTDFPVQRAKTVSQLQSLSDAGLRPALLTKIASNRI